MENFTDNFGWLEIAFVYAVALGFGAYQIWSVNREIKRDKASKAEGEKDRSDPSRHAEGEHELDER